MKNILPIFAIRNNVNSKNIMKKFKISFCSSENCGVRYFTDIEFGTLRSAKKVMNALENEGYEVYLYRLKKGGRTNRPWDDWEEIEKAA